MGKFVTGEDYKEDGADQKTFGIHNRTPGEEWGNQIEVYGDEDLRDRILRLLQEDGILKAERDEAAFALRAVLAGKPVRNADEIIARSEKDQIVFGPTGA